MVVVWIWCLVGVCLLGLDCWFVCCFRVSDLCGFVLVSVWVVYLVVGFCELDLLVGMFGFWGCAGLLVGWLSGVLASVQNLVVGLYISWFWVCRLIWLPVGWLI